MSQVQPSTFVSRCQTPSDSVATTATEKVTGMAIPTAREYQRQSGAVVHRAAVKHAAINAAELTVPTMLWTVPCQVPCSAGTGSDRNTPASANPAPAPRSGESWSARG